MTSTLEEFFDKHKFNQMLKQSLKFLPKHLLKHSHKYFVRQPVEDLINNSKSQLPSISKSSSLPFANGFLFASRSATELQG